MAERAQINAQVKPATKVRLIEFCKARNHSQGEVVEAALEAYFTPADGDTQTLMFQKINGLDQGMKDIVTLLGSVLEHLERQAKPPPPKMATAKELYPELQPAVVVATALDPAATFRGLRHTPPMIDVAQFVEEEAPPPPRSSWRAIFRRRATP